MKATAVFSLSLVLGIPLASLAQTTVDTTVAGQVTITVPEGDADYTLSADDVSALGTDKTLIKMGKGRLIVATDLKTAGYDGEIQIREGYFQARHGNALGGKTQGTTVSSGATLEVYDVTTSYANIFGYETVTVSGSGVDNHGAVYTVRKGASISTNMMFAEGKVILAGDTTVGYSGSEDYDGSCGFRWAILDMNGHTLTFNKGSTSGFYGTSYASYHMRNPGNIVIAVAQNFTLENNSALEGSSENVFRVADGTTLVLNNNDIYFWEKLTHTTPWTLQADGDVTLRAAGNSSLRGWSGPIVIGGTLTTQGAIFLPSAISGAGGITVESGTLTLLDDGNASGVNTYTGTTLVESGATLKADRLSLVPDAATTLTVEDGGLAVLSSAKDTELTDVTLLGVLAHLTDDLYATPQDIGSVVLAPDGHTVTAALAGPTSLAFGGDSTVTVASTEVTDKPHVIAFPGNTTVLSGKGQYGFLEARGGTIEIAKGAAIDFSDNDVFAGADYPNVGRVTVRGTLVSDYKDHAQGSSTYRSVAGIDTGRNLVGTTSACRGIFEMYDGAVVTGKVENGLSETSGGRKCGDYQSKGAMGSYFIHGGTLVSKHGGDGIDTGWIGDTYRSFYMSIEGGKYEEYGGNRFGSAANASAVFHQRGGLYENHPPVGSTDNVFKFGMCSAAVDFLISGGRTFIDNATFSLCPSLDGQYGESGHYATLSVCGEGASFVHTLSDDKGWRSFSMAGTVNMASILNIAGGGILSVPSLERQKTAKNMQGQSVDPYESGTHAYVNFDGGILVPNGVFTTPAYKRATVFANFSNGVDRVTVFEKGATIRTDLDIAVGASLEAPSGLGIESISVPDEIKALPAWAFTGAPRIRISDATGTGASAVADFDTIGGVVTNIIVTSRGNNYSNPTIKIERGGYTLNGTPVSYTATAELTTNVSGGFTKEGTGTLTVDKVCTYTGETVVAGGTLKLGVEGAVAASSGIRMAGGTLDPNGTSFALPVLGGAGTIDATGLTAANELTFDADDLLAKECLTITGTLAINPGTKVRILNAEKLADAPKKSFRLLTTGGSLAVSSLELVGDLAGTKWCVRPTDGGCGLRLIMPVGMTVIIR